jgi:hypothetical protein
VDELEYFLKKCEGYEKENHTHIFKLPR